MLQLGLVLPLALHCFGTSLQWSTTQARPGSARLCAIGAVRGDQDTAAKSNFAEARAAFGWFFFSRGAEASDRTRCIFAAAWSVNARSVKHRKVSTR